MRLLLDRTYKGPDYTIGHLYVDGAYCCDTIEDTDRGLLKTTPIEVIRAKKVRTRTAIPRGTYRVTLSVQSPKFSTRPYYYKFCKAYMPRLLDVLGFEGILIHCGSSERSSAGCIIVGRNTVKGRVTGSQECFERLYRKLKTAEDTIWITIR